MGKDKRIDSNVPPPLCECGCGLSARINKCGKSYTRYATDYCRGKASRGRLREQQHPCECGCGELTTNPHFVNQKHHGRTRIVQRGLAPLCGCGCGRPVRWAKRTGKKRGRKSGWNKYIEGHSNSDPKLRAKMKEVMNTPEKLAELSQKSRDNYLDDEYLRKLYEGRKVCPNRFEALFNILTDTDIEYVGDGKLWIQLPNGKPKNPDFRAGKRKVIELHGDYWHKGEDETELIELYKEAGYDCLVIWEREMVDIESVLGKLAEFIGKETWQMSLF